jgi:hypothetical protein
MKEVKWLGIFIYMVWLNGCAIGSSLQTPTGPPEVTISGGTEKKQIMDILINEALAQGFQVGQTGDYDSNVIFSRRIVSDFGSSILPGSRFDVFPEVRLTVSFIDVAGGIRVICDGVMLTDPVSTFAGVTDILMGKEAQEAQALQEMQALLNRLKERMEIK